MSAQTIQRHPYTVQGFQSTENVHTIIAYGIVIVLLGLIAFGVYSLSKGAGNQLTHFADKASALTRTLPNLQLDSRVVFEDDSPLTTPILQKK